MVLSNIQLDEETKMEKKTCIINDLTKRDYL